ncbi:MAG: response regulator, partial [Chloroflexota bacterium]
KIYCRNLMSKILIIDDEPLSSSLIQAMIEPEGYDVIIANSGQDGIEAVQQENPDVILLDLMMPGINGWQVCKTIRAFSQTPILILSAVIDPNRVMQALEMGATDYLVKPVPKGVLISYLRSFE